MIASRPWDGQLRQPAIPIFMGLLIYFLTPSHFYIKQKKTAPNSGLFHCNLIFHCFYNLFFHCFYNLDNPACAQTAGSQLHKPFGILQG